VRPSVLKTLRLLEPGIAVVTNRLRDVLARSSGYESLTSGTGLLDADPRTSPARCSPTPAHGRSSPTGGDISDEQTFDPWLAPSVENTEWLTAELTPVARPDFTRRLKRRVVPRRGILRFNHPAGHKLQLLRETLELRTDAQTPGPCCRRQTEVLAAVRRGWHRAGSAVASPTAILSAERLISARSAFGELPSASVDRTRRCVGGTRPPHPATQPAMWLLRPVSPPCAESPPCLGS
jgi:hypothetical protein